MNSLNDKIKSSFNDNQSRALVSGQYGFNETDGVWNKLRVNDQNELIVTASPAGGDATAANQVLSIASTDAIDAKITKGSDMTLTEAQQVLVYGCDSGGTLRPQKMTTSGIQQVEVEAMRVNGNQNGWTIANGATATSTEIQMGGNTRVAFYGDTDNTFNANFHIEYSQDGVSWFRGSDDNSKVIIVSATGNFYDEEIITPPRVRLTRTNNSGAIENINLYWTRL